MNGVRHTDKRLMVSYLNECNQFQRPFRIMFCAELLFIEQALNLQSTNIFQSKLRKGTLVIARVRVMHFNFK